MRQSQSLRRKCWRNSRPNFSPRIVATRNQSAVKRAHNGLTMADQLRILVIGAHPDDADIKAGGTAAKWCALGHVVKLVSLTNGEAGHQTQHGPQLAERRLAEARAPPPVIGATYDVFDHPDGQLDDRLEYRHEVIRLLRTFRPDLVITHRATDYHPDHRFTGLLVQDASYLVTVPAICPETPHLPSSPVIMCFSD